MIVARLSEEKTLVTCFYQRIARCVAKSFLSLSGGGRYRIRIYRRIGFPFARCFSIWGVGDRNLPICNFAAALVSKTI